MRIVDLSYVEVQSSGAHLATYLYHASFHITCCYTSFAHLSRIFYVSSHTMAFPIETENMGKIGCMRSSLAEMCHVGMNKMCEDGDGEMTLKMNIPLVSASPCVRTKIR